MKPAFGAVMAFCIALTACRSQNATTRVDGNAWIADLRFLERELPERHPNAFHSVSRDSFGAEVARLASAIPAMTEHQRLVGMMRIVALVGDGHTHLDLPPSWPPLPIELQWFGNSLRIVAAPSTYRAALGGEIIRVGTTPIAEVIAMAEALVPRKENTGRTRFTATRLLSLPEVLHGMGVVPSPDSVELTVRQGMADSMRIILRPGTPADFEMAIDGAPPLYLQRLNEPLWFTALADRKSVYVSFSGYPPEAGMRERADSLGRLIDAMKATRLIIDLRRNGGGDFDRFRRILLPVMTSRPGLKAKGAIYVITGPATFSAAMVNAIDLRREVGAILVGEPTGARPNSYSEHGEFRLPNTGLRVSHSTRFYRFAADSDDAVVPDHPISTSWDDFRRGHDPVLAWILAQRLP